MRDFIQYKKNQHTDSTTPFGFNHIIALKADDFNDFRTGTHAELFINANPPPVTSAGSKQCTPAELFNKSSKRDSSAYPILKSDTAFDNWNRTIRAIATVQDVFEPLDENAKTKLINTQQ